MENELSELIEAVPCPLPGTAREAKRRWDSIAKPLGSLGLLEDALIRVSAVCGTADLALKPRKLLVFCADNGVVAEGVSQCGSEVTAAVTTALGAGRSTVNPMAALADCRVQAVDVGVRDYPGAANVWNCRVQNGTGNIAREPAMSRENCLRAILTGAELAKREAAEGTRLLLVGEMGIGNTTTAAAVTAVLLGLDPAAVTGRGAGLSDAGLARKQAVVRQAITVNRPDPDDPIDVLTKVGGLDLAAMCGAYLGAASVRLPVLIDGCISAAAALCACRLCPRAGEAMLASHLSAEPMGEQLLKALRLSPLLCAGLRLGEGGGAVCALPLLDQALAVYRSGQSFERLGIEAYTPQE